MRRTTLLLPAALALACAPSGEPSSHDRERASQDPESACAAHFSVQTTARCGGAPLPADQVQPMRARFLRSCEARLSLRGSSLTASSVEACAAAAQQLPCDATTRPPACIVAPGALADGSSCSDDAQCASTRCSRAFGTPADGGPVVVPACGTCTPAGRAGEPCAAGPAGCVDGTECAHVDGGTRCEPVPSSPAPAADAGASRSSQKAPTLAAPGDACGDSSVCLLGACPGKSGTCPRALPDGASCTAFDPSAPCDSFAACTGGRCGLEYTVSCP